MTETHDINAAHMVWVEARDNAGWVLSRNKTGSLRLAPQSVQERDRMIRAADEWVYENDCGPLLVHFVRR